MSTNNTTTAKSTSALSVLVTGAARGIGFELVRQYATASNRNTVIAAVRNPSTATALRQLTQQHSNITIITLDVSDDASIKSSLTQVTAVTRHLNILINNAGIVNKSGKNDTALEVTKSELLELFTVNVAGPVAVIQTFLPLLRSQSPPAVVANISTGLASNVISVQWGAAQAGYGASKAALTYITTQLSANVKDVIFLSISPGWVQTDMGKAAGSPPTKVEDSAKGIRRVIATKTTAESGSFVDFEKGEVIPF